MADWDADSPQLRRNLAKVLATVKADAQKRGMPKVAAAKRWQRETMAGLTVPNRDHVGRFRGEPALKNVGVMIGGVPGIPTAQVAKALQKVESTLQFVIAAIDAKYPVGTDLDVDGLAAVFDLAAWAHSEWVRIHPFVNGNGRTSRIWANFVLMCYGIPPAVRLRPRPDGGYAAACASAMSGDWKPTAVVFHKMVREAIVGSGTATSAKPP